MVLLFIIQKMRKMSLTALFHCLIQGSKQELQECRYSATTSDREWMPYSTKFAEDEEIADAELSSVSTAPSSIETDLHCEWLNALNHQHLSEVSIAADQMLLNRIVNQGLDKGKDFSYLSESSNGDGFTGTGEETFLFQDMQSAISSIKTRGDE